MENFSSGTDLTRVILRGSDGMAIFLAILKWIGIVLGGVLGLALLLVVLVICVPVRYYLSGSNRDVLRYQYRVSWLCHVVSVVKKPDSDQVWFRILGIPVCCLAGGNTRGQQKTHVEKKEEGKEEKRAAPDARPEREKGKGEHRSGAAGNKKKKPKKRKKKDASSKKKEKRKKSFSFDMLSGIIKFVRDTENRHAFHRIREELRKLLCYLAPRKVKGCFVIGTGDPSSTGLVIGGISLLPFAYQEGIEITPDFNDKVFQADGMIKGRVQVLYFIRLCIRLYRDKELRKLWDNIQKFKKEAA